MLKWSYSMQRPKQTHDRCGIGVMEWSHGITVMGVLRDCLVGGGGMADSAVSCFVFHVCNGPADDP